MTAAAIEITVAYPSHLAGVGGAYTTLFEIPRWIWTTISRQSHQLWMNWFCSPNKPLFRGRLEAGSDWPGEGGWSDFARIACLGTLFIFESAVDDDGDNRNLPESKRINDLMRREISSSLQVWNCYRPHSRWNFRQITDWKKPFGAHTFRWLGVIKFLAAGHFYCNVYTMLVYLLLNSFLLHRLRVRTLSETCLL